MDRIRANFQDPPASHRTAPLWVWNDEMSEAQIVFQLGELKSHGFGGAFIHPRPGLVTPYLSDEWFRLWNFALQTAKSLSMKLYIYDENSYPSGFAGGHVSSQLPDCLANGMTYTVTADLSQIAGQQIIRAFTLDGEGNSLDIKEDLSPYPVNEWMRHGEKFFIVTLVKPQTTGWLAGFSYVDVLRPEVTERFLKTTHEAYEKRFGDEFGSNIPAIFTDEPNIGNGGAYSQGSPALPFSFWLAHEFELQHGYSLLDNIPCIFKNVTGQFDHPAEKVRYDYYSTLHTLWIENAIKPISQWCEDHHIAWTGHYLEHQWPFAYSYNASPSLQSHYEYHQWPAIDMLLSTYLRNEETHALTLTIQEIRSAANQFQKERTLCELYGAGGWDSTFEDYKRMGDWVLVNGINFINQHLTYCTIAGARKRDHPQSFDWREPWWDQYTQMNDYLGRASYLLSQGVMQQRILLLNPSTTGYLVPYEEEKGSIFSGAGTDAIVNPDMSLFLETLQSLADHQCDYDLGDEYTMKRHAVVKDKKLVLGAQQYDVVIVSGNMKNMLASTAELLKAMIKSGGHVIACGEPGSYIEGEENKAAYDEMKNGWIKVGSALELTNLLQGLLPERIKSSAPWAKGVTHMRRVLKDGREVYFFVNHHMGKFDTTVTLHGRSVCQWSLFTGLAESIAYTEKDGTVSFELSLERNQSVMLVVGEKAPEAARPMSNAGKKITMPLTSVRRETQNMLPISYCDLSTGIKTYKDIYVLRGADLLFSERGFDGNPWDSKVQYRNNVMDRNHYGSGSGFKADYYFTVSMDFHPASLFAVAEQPALCRLLINEHPVEWLREPDSLDHHFGTADILEYAVPGLNKITLLADRFDVRLELETLYLRGEFSVKAMDGKWIVDKPEPMQYGSWKSQGCPFYSGAMVYRYTVRLPEKPHTALLHVGRYESTAVSLEVNGQNAGLVGVDGRRPVEIAPLLQPGENTIEIRVCGSLKNLLGPHFISQPIRGSAWPAMWREAPVFHQPSPEKYDLMDFGLMEDPVLFID